MGDNTTTEIAGNTTWWIPLLSAIGGAIIALIGKEITDWVRRPRLNTDFEKRGKLYPFIFNIQENYVTREGDLMSSKGKKYIRLCVFNKGKSTAFGCEIKLEIRNVNKSDIERPTILKWTRTEPRLHEKNTYSQESITINRDDKEFFNLAHLSFTKSKNVTENKTDSWVSIEDPDNSFFIGKNIHYQIKTTVSSNNAEPSIFFMNIYWDGTEEGFDKAFTKV